MKMIEKMPPEVSGGTEKDLREIAEYLNYLREQINYISVLQNRRIDAIEKEKKDV